MKVGAVLDLPPRMHVGAMWAADSPLSAALQRASESHRELAQQRLRHTDSMRIEMESARGRLRTVEEDNAHKQALISHNTHQVMP